VFGIAYATAADCADPNDVSFWNICVVTRRFAESILAHAPHTDAVLAAVQRVQTAKDIACAAVLSPKDTERLFLLAKEKLSEARHLACGAIAPPEIGA